MVRASFGLSASGAITKFPRVTSLALEPFAENLFSISTNPIWTTSMAVTFICMQLRWFQECYKAYTSGRLVAHLLNAWSFFEFAFLLCIWLTFIAVGKYRREVTAQFETPMREDAETPRLALLFANAMEVRDHPWDSGVQKVFLGPKDDSLSEFATQHTSWDSLAPQ